MRCRGDRSRSGGRRMRPVRGPRGPGRRRGGPGPGGRRHHRRGGGEPPRLRQGTRTGARTGLALRPAVGRAGPGGAGGGGRVRGQGRSRRRRHRRSAGRAGGTRGRAARGGRRGGPGAARPSPRSRAVPDARPRGRHALPAGRPGDARPRGGAPAARLEGTAAHRPGGDRGADRHRRRGARGAYPARGDIHAPAVVNAAGPWGGEMAARAGVSLPVLPRRGFVLVTEPLPPRVRHKVYAADYVADVASDSAGLQTSPVVEGTPAGPVLIGASRERVGFDRTVSLPALRALAAGATRLFPFLAGVRAMRSYAGFRPYLPDHLPAIGPDPRAPGLLHACGHEGAGIGLATGTGHLIAQALTGRAPDLDLTPFRPDRFPEEAA
ncbi:oxidoreductase [Streptomyces viridochromogenes DSM 40736]|uniref:Oxidoreductase n=1 Tax=Streptomyces viridochromogenes (strain DSM 40736 / JCM 4977 / BCRC 1201 / Tue 494) TaxID=591159 RepID=D9X758_STRVT|nr:oxidoreductase [Streptomyces viridochromogenes DSM 40736]